MALDPDFIFPGQILLVPDGTGMPGSPMQIYLVRSGDTLDKIAQCFGTTAEAIAEVNGIPNPDLIFVDQILRIPAPRAARFHMVRPGDTLDEIFEKRSTYRG